MLSNARPCMITFDTKNIDIIQLERSVETK